MKLYHPRLVEKAELAKAIYSFWLCEPELAREVAPGQFIGIRVRDGLYPFLRRPFSIAQRVMDQFQIVFKIRGEGTQLLARTPPGEALEVLGPLGSPLPKYSGERLLLVGGGVGIAPLLFLTQSSTDSNPLWVLVGAKTASDLILIPELFECTERLGFATEDGSKGKKGLVTDLIRPALNEFSASIIFTCGPQPMLKAIQGMGLEIPCYGFLESRLGCGCGLCLGCAVKSSRGGYYRVCKEGPVFNLKEIVL